MSKTTRLVLIVLTLVAMQCFAERKGTSKPNDAAVPGLDLATATPPPGYLIGPGDVLIINVWHEPDVSGSIPVRPDGKVSVPLLADVQAAGLMPTVLAESIREKLSKFVTNPQVTVTVSVINSQHFFIVGEVSHTGSFPLGQNMTILQAIANAGSFSPYANLSKIYVLRQANGIQTKIPFDYKQVVKGNKIDQNIQLQTGDTIVVP